LEWQLSKTEILQLYASHAPFGGNVVGLDAACWRYFGRERNTLSWGEAALLAVLPNSPGLIHPGRNRNQLKAKRDGLLRRLHAHHVIDSLTSELAQAEPLPDEPLPLPRMARHLLPGVKQHGQNEVLRSTLNYDLQNQVEAILKTHHKRLMGNLIHNAAALVADVATGEVLVYAGNVNNGDRFNGDDVDIIQAPRSTGSILKPFLYAAMLDEGKILPRTFLPDVPTFINGFAPRNFNKHFDGAVAADQALIRSLNIPAVNLLREYRYERFHSLLGNIGMTTLNKPPDHYGLSLILGGAEGTLWDVCGMYASMARTLNNYFTHPGKNKYSRSDYHPLTYLTKQSSESGDLEETTWINAAAIFNTVDALKELYRPGEETGWRMFESARPIAWKTGTSFGFRDGWAVGMTPRYVVGVWAGNADGEGRPGLTGTDAAAPILFEIFAALRDDGPWFKRPEMEMEHIAICSQSGHRRSEQCVAVDTVWVPARGLGSGMCPYHKRVYLSRDGKTRVHSQCENVSRMIAASWFVLPAVQEHYYKAHSHSYRSLPPYRMDCAGTSALQAMDVIYPRSGSKVFIPRDINGKPGQVVFQIAHRNPDTKVFWHLDGEYVGVTEKTHNFGLNPPSGWHELILVDEKGESIKYRFQVLSEL
jgi:penicillin-binding protein 1C